MASANVGTDFGGGAASERLSIRDLGYNPGSLPIGPRNSILDVPGVQIGQATINDVPSVRAGVTVIFPRPPSEINIPCYAGMHTLNGNGEVTGCYQIKDWGFTNTPIALTNSCSIGIVLHEVWQWILAKGKEEEDREEGQSVPQTGTGRKRMKMARDYGTPIVGETADWWLNDFYESVLPSEVVKEAISKATNGKGQTAVLEGQNGGGAGMTCHQFPGGTGTSSRMVKGADGEEYTVGVLVQANYGHKEFMRIGGVPVGRLLMREAAEEQRKKDEEVAAGKAGEGSIVVLIFTDAPMLPHQLVRLGQRATVGLSQVGSYGIGRNSSGDIFLALSTANKPNEQMTAAAPNFMHPELETNTLKAIKNECVDAVFRAAAEATEEAILNSMVAGREGRITWDGAVVEGMPVERARELLKQYLVV